MTTITIDRVDETVYCTPRSGNLVMNKCGTVKWQIRNKSQRFRLTFRFEPFQGMPSRQEDWPFSRPSVQSTDWVEEFSATALDYEGVFKYLVEVKDADGSIARLDPVIIIRS